MENLLEGLLPPEIHTRSATIEDCVGALLPAEYALVASAIPSRQHEFATGRLLARRILAELGRPQAPLLRDGDRVPCWPAGIVGSISHSGSLCVVAVGPESRYRGIGVDLEPDEPAKRDIQRVVCQGDEHAWVSAVAGAERGRRCRILFSIKEAVYKAFYPRTRELWSFQDVEVSIDLAGGRYRARLPESAGVAEVAGRVHRKTGWIVAGAVCEEGGCPRDVPPTT